MSVFTAAAAAAANKKNPTNDNDNDDHHDHHPDDHGTQHHHECLVCYEPLEKSTTKTPCDHNSICGICHLRLRYLHQDQKCPICKTLNAQVIVDVARSDARTFHEYPLWGDSLGADYVYLDDAGMFFEKQYYETSIQPLLGYRCGLPGCNYDGVSPHWNVFATKESAGTTTAAPSQQQQQQSQQPQQQQPQQQKPTSTAPIKALQDHLRTVHRTALCNLCVDHRRDFVALLPRFTPTQLRAHLSNGGNSTQNPGETGHPMCEFCKPTRYYDMTLLYQHLGQDHYKCHVCQQQLGLDDQYYRDYKQLEKHFDRQHFLCHDVQCLTSRFVVFGSELDLRHHERTVHGGTSTGSTKLQLEFRVRGAIESSQHVPDDSDFQYGLDGTAFVPSAVFTSTSTTSAATRDPNQPNHHDHNTPSLHPLHVQRTAALRRQAEALRRSSRQGGDEGGSAFPALQATTDAAAGTTGGDASSQRLRMGWNEGSTLQRVGRRTNAGEVSEQDFPALPATATPSHKSNNTIRRGPTLSATATAPPPQSRQLAAIAASAATDFPPIGGTAPSSSSSTPPSWVGAGRVTPSPTISHLPTRTAFAAPASVTQSMQSNNLAAENFPSLGPPPSTGRKPYAAANALAKKMAAQPSDSLSTNHFPSLASTVAAAHSTTTHTVARSSMVPQPLLQPLRPQQPPALDSAADFPSMEAPPPSSSRAPHTRSNNNDPAAAKAAVEDVKATIGAVKFKQLRRYTKDFADGTMSPEDYVESAATLFEGGANDTGFWAFVPAVLETCPDAGAARRAARHLDRLGATAPNTGVRAAVSGLNVPGVGRNANHDATPSWSALSSTPSGATQLSRLTVQPTRVPVLLPAAPPLPSRSVPKNAWGGATGSASTVVRAKAPPGSVAVAAASPAQPGSATKFMAKEQKQQKLAPLQDSTKKQQGGKKKQKDELRQLAFGA